MRWLTNRTAGSQTYLALVSILGVWLAAWILLSWPAIQDDALIHLRYADNLYLHHIITYDGVHSNYGASSLLYVSLLASLRSVTTSPQLPRAVSSAVHLLMFSGLAVAFGIRLAKSGQTARLAGALMLMLTVTPSAVRWLDDGMETGLVVSTAVTLAWLIHAEIAGKSSRGQKLLIGVIAFFAVVLRTELLLLCGAGFVILMVDRSRLDLTPSRTQEGARNKGEKAGRFQSAAAILAGAGLAIATILSTMHVLLPDTALAKSHGIANWFRPIHDAAITLGGAFSFGLGMLLFWLLTLGLAVRRGQPGAGLLLANSFAPTVLLLSSLRGQEIQGVRYFAWTFFFSTTWNILELARLPELPRGRINALLLYCFLAFLVIEVPFESLVMLRVLVRRAGTMRTFEAQHLEVLHSARGVASDVGYIGYFTGAEICDLAGLINGRVAAGKSSTERLLACAKTNPGFVFGNASQISSIAAVMDISGWKNCGHYDFTNVTTLDRHSLLVKPGIAEQVCGATSERPSSASTMSAVR